MTLGPETIRLTIGQLCITDGPDVLRQVETVLQGHRDSDLHVFPEFSALDAGLSLPTSPVAVGPHPLLASWLQRCPSIDSVRDLAVRHSARILTGVLALEDGTLRSRAVLIEPDGQAGGHYDKTHVHWSEPYLTPGDALVPLDTGLGPLGVLICYDLAFGECALVHARRGVELLVVISAVPAAFPWEQTQRRLSGAATFGQFHVAHANQGRGPQTPMGGHSAVFDPRGVELARLDHDGPGSLTATLDRLALRAWRKEEPVSPRARPELYGSARTEDEFP